MTISRVFELIHKIEGSDSIEFRQIRLAPDGIPFAQVEYLLNGEKVRALRLDLDKRVFLDHFEDDPEMEAFLARAAFQIVDYVSDCLDAAPADSNL